MKVNAFAKGKRYWGELRWQSLRHTHRSATNNRNLPLLWGWCHISIRIYFQDGGEVVEMGFLEHRAREGYGYGYGRLDIGWDKSGQRMRELNGKKRDLLGVIESYCRFSLAN